MEIVCSGGAYNEGRFGGALCLTSCRARGGLTSKIHAVVDSNGLPVRLGDGKMPADQPSFKNTLSAGDRCALALAVSVQTVELVASSTT
jgi:hypothetical protein